MRGRLALLFTAGSAVILILSGVLIYLDLNGELGRTINNSLLTRAHDIAADVAAGQIEIRQEEAFAQILGTPPGPGSGAAAMPAVEVVDSSAPGPAVLSPGEVADALRGDVFHDRRIPSTPALGKRARLLAHPVRSGGRTLVVVVGASLDAVIRGRERLALILALLSPLLGGVLSAGGWLLAGAALRPVRRMSQEADAISLAQVGRRLAEPPGEDEIAELGRTLNAMLDRIEAAFARERMFLDDASHELRTPIAVLRAELEMALLESGDRQAMEQSLRSALEEAERLAHLAEDLLVLARATAGRLPLRRHSVDVLDLVKSTVDRHPDRLAGDRATELKTRVEGGETMAVVDPVRLEQVIVNLVGNARRFARGEVRVAVRTEGDDACIVVADDGPGFPEALLPVVFDRFTRAEAARGHRTGAGAGLGLAIVAAIVRAHGGTITATNGPPLGGASVAVRFPLDETGPVPEAV